MLATTSKDKKLRVIDPRSTECLRKGDSHQGTKASKVNNLSEFGLVSEGIIIKAFPLEQETNNFSLYHFRPSILETLGKYSQVDFLAIMIENTLCGHNTIYPLL